MKNSITKKICFVVTMCAALLTTGCQSKSDLAQELEDAVSVIEVEQPVSVSRSDLPETKAELLAMDTETFKSMIQEKIPNYREFFLVPKDYVIEDKDWVNFKEILCIQLFGNAIPDETQEETQQAEDAASSDEKEEEDPNWIYYAPTAEYVESLTMEEFLGYLAGLQEYLYPESEKVDYSQLTKEQLKQVREKLISDLE